MVRTKVAGTYDSSTALSSLPSFLLSFTSHAMQIESLELRRMPQCLSERRWTIQGLAVQPCVTRNSSLPLQFLTMDTNCLFVKIEKGIYLKNY